ncbi:hypothetical protein CFP56_013036 [Quercus suber]|uniref:Uncharacterized protein n=1 Tax=Quercus suber TaxID=58331 RepID=A0AAW0M566_QUESU
MALAAAVGIAGLSLVALESVATSCRSANEYLSYRSRIVSMLSQKDMSKDIVSIRSSSRRINHIFPDKHNELFWLKAHNKQSSQSKICGRTAHDYVVTVAPGSPSNLCDTLGIAYNGRFQEEIS